MRLGSDQRGFTLLEMMLVLLLLGMGTFLVVNQLPNRSYRAEQESQRLAQRLQKLVYQAALEGRMYGLHVQPDRWQLKVWRARKWQNISLPQNADAQILPAGWHLQLSTPTTDSETITEAPQVLLWPGGEVTPFRLRYFWGDRLMAEVMLDDEGRIHTRDDIDEKP